MRGTAKTPKVRYTKGDFVKEPKDVRPTSSKVLQALFNILGFLEGKSFLDLFAGTGRVAAEAWKRGAQPVVAVELLRQRGESLLPLLGGRHHAGIPPRDSGPMTSEYAEGPVVLWCDVRRALRQLHRQERTFDIIFADPPYDAGWGKELVAMLQQGEIPLASGGILILEHTVREPIPSPGICWDCEERVYGETALRFFRTLRSPEAPSAAQ